MKDLELKINLMTKGIKIPKKTKNFLIKEIGDKFYNDDYVTTTGIMLEINDEVFVTVNINKKSPYSLEIEDGSLLVVEKNERVTCKIWPPSEFMVRRERNEYGLLTDIVNAHFDRARISPIFGCSFNCGFCSWNEREYRKIPLEEIVKGFDVAIKDDRITHVLISGGTPKKEDLPYLTEVYEYFCKNYPQYDFDVMMTPRGFDSLVDESQYEDYLKHLKKIGVKGLSINIELFNDEVCKKYCKEKYALGKEKYIKFLTLAGKIFGPDKVRSGLIVGLESEEDTLKAVEEICKCGCMPMLSPYMPYNGIGSAPNANILLEVLEKTNKICKKYNIKLAPICKKCKHNTL